MRKTHVKESAMRRRLPPLKTLPAFEIAAERLSFTAAAGELHLTHGAISRQIQALESHLGVPRRAGSASALLPTRWWRTI
jgi:DNA-binding transcriptional LysR family regulator